MSSGAHIRNPRARPTGKPIVVISLIAAAQALLWGCGQRVAGVYVDSSGATRYEFRPGGEVFISVLGTTVTARYEENAERVLISGPQGTVVLIRKNGRLEGPMGLELTPDMTDRKNHP